MEFSGLLLLGSAVLLGLRHGIDYDHIAAITDISGSQFDKKTSFLNALGYALGHGFVIITFGLLAVSLGIRLPSWVDMVMEPIVGVTLIILGIWILFAIITQRNNFKIVSRWGLIFRSARKLKHTLFHKISPHNHPHESITTTEPISFKGAFGIGMIHGVGAETPTQLLLFVTAAGVGGVVLGNLLVLSFVLGLVISNSLIALISIYGFSSVQKNPKIYMGLGTVSALFSLVVGILFITGNGVLLPAL
jgi:high-affinity nickel permease